MGSTALTAAGIAAPGAAGNQAGVAAIKNAAAEDAGKLPDDATLAAHVGGSRSASSIILRRTRSSCWARRRRACNGAR